MGVVIQLNTIIQGRTIIGYVKPPPTIAAAQEYRSASGANSSIAINTITAPANSILVLMLTSNTYTDTLTSIGDSVGLTWTKRADGGSGGNHYQYIYTAPFVAGGSITVTSTYTPAVSGRVESCLCAVINSSGVGAAPSLVSSTLSITTTATNSLLLGFVADINGQQSTYIIYSPALSIITTPINPYGQFLYTYATTIGTYTYTPTNLNVSANNNGQIIELKA